VPAVWLGGVVTLIVVAVTAVFAPQLREMDLRAEFVPPLQEMENGQAEKAARV
jgi:hypothetical protein